MAHTCPSCGAACYCGDDCDDVLLDCDDDVAVCIHCAGRSRGGCDDCCGCGDCADDFEQQVFDGMADAFGRDLVIEQVRFYEALRRRYARVWARNHGRRWVAVRAQFGGGRKPWW